MTMTIADGLIAEGEIKGELKGQRKMITRVVQQKFGKELPPNLKRKLERCTDHEQLEAFMAEVVDADSIAKLHF